MKSLKVLTEPPPHGSVEKEASYPPVFRLLGHDGLYEVRSSRLGSFVARMETETTIREGFFPTVPRCPVALLSDTVSLFGERPDTEAMVSVVLDVETREFHLIWQGEIADASSVEYEPLPEDDRYLLYAEIHSHHRMPAFFSAQDDKAERKLGLYGVIGRVDREKPEALFRYACGPYFRPVRAEDLFEPAPELWRLIEQPYL